MGGPSRLLHVGHTPLLAGTDMATGILGVEVKWPLKCFRTRIFFRGCYRYYPKLNVNTTCFGTVVLIHENANKGTWGKVKAGFYEFISDAVLILRCSLL